MRPTVLLISLLLLGIPVFQADGNSPEPLAGVSERYVEVLYTTEAPVLDGYIQNQEWQTQFTISYFDGFDGDSFREIYPEVGSDEVFTDQADLAITFYMLYDETFLYFAANVTDNNIVIDSGATYWRDDGIELLIDGAHDMDEDQRADDPWPGFEDGTTLLALADGSYFHDYSNGTPYQRDFGSDDDWYTSTRTAPANNYYIVEMRVRLDAISSPGPNSTIGLNIGVNDDDTGADSKTALKWTGTETDTGEIPTFRNETLWGSAYLKPYVEAELPGSIHIDEDEEVLISSNLSFGNHPMFETQANYTWTLPLYNGFTWNNLTIYGADFVHTFFEPRSYYVLNLEIKDPVNIMDKTSMHVFVHDITPPLIQHEDGVALEEEPYAFILNVSDNVGIDRVNWSLYDTVWRNSSTPTPFFDHTFFHPGNYSLQYTVFDFENNSAEGSSIITVVDNSPPTITMDIQDIHINTSEFYHFEAPYTFDDTADGPSSDLVYGWSFHGPFGVYDFQGNTTEVNLPVPGEYDATLKVWDAVGLFATKSFNVTVLDNTPPIPSFFLPLEMGELTMLELNATGSFDNDPLFWNGTSFKWSVILEGKTTWVTSLEGPLVEVTFPFPGTASVSLLMTDTAGNNITLNKTVVILDITPPSARLWVDPEIVDQGASFYINITGSLENVKLVSVHYVIYMITPEGPTEILSSPFFGIRLGNATSEDYINFNGLWVAINEPGTYLINITLEDSSGLRDNASETITVRDSIPPVAAVNRTLVHVNIGETFHLSASDSSDESGAMNFVWLLGNSTSIGLDQQLEYAFFETGEYEIMLTVIDAGGNVDSITCKIIVSDPLAGGSGDRADYTIVYVIWSIAVLIIIIGIIALFFWASKKRAAVMGHNEEE
jgi:Carbohydrate family 9 binding domain-like/PKD domain